ncbi:MAG: sugar isomerase domain-containing protein [Mycoplasma sp.]
MNCYKTKIIETINKIDEASIEEASSLIYNAYKNKNRIWVFGTGHSALFAIDLYVRAGGLDIFSPVYFEELIVTDIDPLRSTNLERDTSFIKRIYEKYDFKENDVFISISNSGRNILNVELSLQLKNKGLKLICMSSKKHTNSVKSRHSSKKKLIDIADVFLDNCAPIGDTLITFNNQGYCPVSTVTGTIIFNMIIEKLAKKIPNLDSYKSANLDNTDEENLKKFGKY